MSNAPNYKQSQNGQTCATCHYGQFDSVCLKHSFKCTGGHTCDTWQATTGPVSLAEFKVIDLPVPHGFLLWRGKQTAVASPDQLPFGTVLITSEGEAYGLATLSGPAQMALSEFEREAQAEKHRIRPEERKFLWPEAESMYVYQVKAWIGFGEPVPVEGGRLIDYQPTQEEAALIEKARRLPKTIILNPEAVSWSDGNFTALPEARNKELSAILGASYGQVRYLPGKGDKALALYSLALVRQPALRFEKILSRVQAAEKAHSGIMVALMLPETVARKLALDIPGALPPEELHLTLAYLGKKDEIGDRGLIEKALARFAGEWGPLSGKVNGTGRFNTLETDGTNAFYASFDSPALPEFRQELVSRLNGIGVEHSTLHGFTPHITLAYLPEGDPLSGSILMDGANGIEVTFNELCLAWGDEHLHFPFGSQIKKKSPIKRAEHKQEAKAMPYEIERMAGGVCVVNSETGETEECYEGEDAMEQAQALLAALIENVEEADEMARKPKKKPMKKEDRKFLRQQLDLLDIIDEQEESSGGEGEKRSLQQLEQIREQFHREFCDDRGDYRENPWLIDITEDDTAIANWQGTLWSVPFNQINGQAVFAQRYNWLPVTVSYVPVESGMAMKATIATGEKAFDDSPWDGAASNWDTAEAYCRDCLIDVNSGGDKVKANCKLPYRRPGTTNPNINALRVMPTGRGIVGVTKPADVPQDRWDSAVWAAANKLIGWWPDAFDKPAPDSIYSLAGKEPPAEKAGRRLGGAMMDKLRTAMEMIRELMNWGEYADQEEEMPEEGMMEMLKGDSGVAVKMVNGEPWHFSWSANAFEDRDGEIFSLKSLEQYVLENEENEVKGWFNTWHIPKTDFAEKRWQAVVGKFLVEAGPYLKDKKGRAARKFFEQHPKGHPELAPEGWGSSVEYRYLPEQRKDKIYEWTWITRTSTLPRGAAANIWTKATQEFVMTDDQKKMAAALFGEDFVEELVTQGEHKTQQLEAAGVASKEVHSLPVGKAEAKVEGAGEKAPPAPEETPEGEKGDLEPPEVKEAPESTPDPNQAIEALAAKMLANLNEALAPALTTLQQQITTLGEQVGDLGDEVKELKGEQALKTKTELPRFTIDLVRASQAKGTIVSEEDALKDKKPQETSPLTDGSLASAFFPARK